MVIIMIVATLTNYTCMSYKKVFPRKFATRLFFNSVRVTKVFFCTFWGGGMSIFWSFFVSHAYLDKLVIKTSSCSYEKRFKFLNYLMKNEYTTFIPFPPRVRYWFILNFLLNFQNVCNQLWPQHPFPIFHLHLYMKSEL